MAIENLFNEIVGDLEICGSKEKGILASLEGLSRRGPVSQGQIEFLRENAINDHNSHVFPDGEKMIKISEDQFSS